jgi:hypothetical protein
MVRALFGFVTASKRTGEGACATKLNLRFEGFTLPSPRVGVMIKKQYFPPFTPFLRVSKVLGFILDPVAILAFLAIMLRG